MDVLKKIHEAGGPQQSPVPAFQVVGLQVCTAALGFFMLVLGSGVHAWLASTH